MRRCLAVQDDGRRSWGDETLIEDLRVLFPGEILDISADAHEAVRLTYKASIAPVRSASPEDGRTGEGRAADGPHRRRPRTASTAAAPRLTVGAPAAPDAEPRGRARPEER